RGSTRPADGQTRGLKLSTPRGALQTGVNFRRRLTAAGAVGMLTSGADTASLRVVSGIRPAVASIRARHRRRKDSSSGGPNSGWTRELATTHESPTRWRPAYRPPRNQSLV